MKPARLIIALLYFLPLTSFCQPVPNVKPEKHCGSGFTESFIPDKIFGCSFTAACKAHDICYGRCGQDGDLRGSDYCEKSEFSRQRFNSKLKCDRDFYNAIDIANNKKLLCRSVGYIYTSAVVIAAQGPFDGIPMHPDVIRRIALSSTTPEEAGEKANSLILLNRREKIDLSQLYLDDGQLLINLKDPSLRSPFNKNGVLVIKNGTPLPNIRSLQRSKQ